MSLIQTPGTGSPRGLLGSLVSQLAAGIAAETSEEEGAWKPLPGPQTLAFHTAADELFYGGAAGGGKSDLLLGLGLKSHRKSIIFRREYPQLKELLLRSHEVYGTLGRFNGQQNIWRGLPGGRVVEFGAVQMESDKNKYKGRAHDLKGWDELPDFTEGQFRFINAWNRTTDAGQRCRVVGAGNPPTHAMGEWVIRYWAPWLDSQHPNPAEPGELRWFVVIDGKDVEREDGRPFDWKGETLTPRSRTFIPARVEDNPFLLASGYKATLQNVPEPLRSQLLYGDFSVGLDDDPWQICPTAWVRAAQARWRPDGRPAGVPLSALGVDVARGGKAKTVLSKRYEHWFAPLVKHEGKDTPDGPAVAAKVYLVLDEPEALVIIDAIGVGASAYDSLRGNDVNVFGFVGSNASKARDRSGRLGFANKRAEAWWHMRELLDPAYGEEIALPPDPELLSDLCAPRWGMTVRGVKVEDKDEIGERIGRSPDCGDAVVYAAYQHTPTTRFVPIDPALLEATTPQEKAELAREQALAERERKEAEYLATLPDDLKAHLSELLGRGF
jgi:hypothetical protein